jgi:glutathione synthase/RimK-type ligase-like ATP-grasp enzyme
MKVAIAKAYNGVHKKISKELKSLGVDTIYFNIDNIDWWKNIKKINSSVDAYFWNSDDKGKYYYQINDRVYLLEQLTGKPVFPNTKQYFFYNNKISQLNFLEYNSLPYPKTFITDNKDKSKAFISKTKYPFVLKDAHSASAMGVYLIKNKSEATKMVNAIFSSEGLSGIFGHFYAQEFISGLEKDLRIITIGGKVSSAYWRINKKDWRHNIGLGGSISDKNIPKKALKLAEKVSKQAGFHWMAYDMLIKDDKITILEFSPNFGTKGASKLGVNIRLEQAKYIKNYLKKAK